MREMDQDGCLVDQEADTHEASQPAFPVLQGYPGQRIIFSMRNPDGTTTEIAGREIYGLDLQPVGVDADGAVKPLDELTYTHEASQNWQHTYEESGISITAGKGGILETWSTPSYFRPSCEPEADTPVVTEAKE